MSKRKKANRLLIWFWGPVLVSLILLLLCFLFFMECDKPTKVNIQEKNIIDTEKENLKNKINNLQTQTNTLSQEKNILDTEKENLQNQLTQEQNASQNEQTANILGKENLINNLNQQITQKNNEITQIEQEINNLNQTLKQVEPIINNIYLLTAEPYNTYINKQGDTIREYSIFTNAAPCGSTDYQGRTNFFETKLFNTAYKRTNGILDHTKIDLSDYFTFAENIDLKDFKTGKVVGGCDDASKNYQFVLTNKQNEHPIILKYNFETDEDIKTFQQTIKDKLTPEENKDIEPYFEGPLRGLFICLHNKKIDYENDSKKIGVIITKTDIDKYPYFRFRTKNLELKLTDKALQFNKEIIKDVIDLLDTMYYRRNRH